MAKTEVSRVDFEKAVGFKIFDWQWEWVKTLGNKQMRVELTQSRSGPRWKLVNDRKEGEMTDGG